MRCYPAENTQHAEDLPCFGVRNRLFDLKSHCGSTPDGKTLLQELRVSPGTTSWLAIGEQIHIRAEMLKNRFNF